MTSTIASRSEEYRRDAQECWKFANDAEDIESKALFQLTAEAWTMLAEQVETLAVTHGNQAAATTTILQSAA
jgi:hypothetical protein